MLQHQTPFVLSFSSLFLTIFFCHCSATQFIVGDSAGWVIPPYPTYYRNWSRSHFIRAGDSLEFDFDAKFYNLIQVSQSEYEHCTALEPLRVFNSSPAIIPLKERGVYFFTCSVSNYCCLGQKIAISVHEGAPENPPLPSAPSPPQVPMISPQLSPNGSAPPPGGMSYPPAPTTSTVPPTHPGSNDGHSPVPGEKSNAVALACGTIFNVSLRRLLSMLATFLGFWVM